MDNVTQCAVGGLDPSGSYNAPCQLLTLRLPPNKSLDASGGSVFLNFSGAAKDDLIRAAASTQTFDTSFVAPAAIGCRNEKSLSIFMDIGFRHLRRCSLVSRIFARATNNQKTARSEVSAARNKSTIRFGQ